MPDRENRKGAAKAPFFPERLVTGVVRLCGAVSTFLILVIFVQITTAVIQRYVFNRPIQWSDEVIGYLLVAMVMLGTAEAFRRGDHISIDLVSTRLSPPIARIQRLFSNLSVIAFALILGVSIWDSITFAYSFGSYSVGYVEIETWIPQVPIVVGAILLGAMAALRLFATLRGERK
ncbi:TRAP-type C4-dicarboxylate transport system, small permease component [Salinihabitans flavidus]|uniref:TRAP transporter small permease protein n=1 Tax=Salinihabitans flavidus TaxID=569882 RepID=A0A1H8MIJ5_9RHOB|nr:TRAP transporter small permease [Salinihabitans flavidus]SEO17231.1 TRAP-type C4-dicarboxylate transport system, small permease component [Salinihabitans flavidus]